MIGKITVKTPNPPCKKCGRMAGLHSLKCPLFKKKKELKK